MDQLDLTLFILWFEKKASFLYVIYYSFIQAYRIYYYWLYNSIIIVIIQYYIRK